MSRGRGGLDSSSNWTGASIPHLHETMARTYSRERRCRHGDLGFLVQHFEDNRRPGPAAPAEHGEEVLGSAPGPGRATGYFLRDGYTMMKFEWLGIFTFGNVWAFISSFSPMIPLRLSRYAVTAYTSSSLSDCGWM